MVSVSGLMVAMSKASMLRGEPLLIVSMGAFLSENLWFDQNSVPGLNSGSSGLCF